MTNRIEYQGQPHLMCICPNCGVLHTIPMSLYEVAKRRDLQIYCPNGHIWTYTKQEHLLKVEQDLRDEKERRQKELEQHDLVAGRLRRSIFSYRAHLGRARNKIAALRGAK